MGIVLEPQFLLAALGILIANAAAIGTVFINLNVKIAENAKDLLSIKSDMEEHKVKNTDDIKELKDITMRDKQENRMDHKEIMNLLGAMTNSFYDFKLEILKAIQKI
jgi:hypothetical protein